MIEAQRIEGTMTISYQWLYQIRVILHIRVLKGYDMV